MPTRPRPGQEGMKSWSHDGPAGTQSCLPSKPSATRQGQMVGLPRRPGSGPILRVPTVSLGDEGDVMALDSWGPGASEQSPGPGVLRPLSGPGTPSPACLLFCKMGLRPSRSVRGRQTQCLHQPYRCSVWSLPCTSHLLLPGSPGPQRSTDAPGTIREPGPWIAGPRRCTLRIDGRPSRMGAGWL